VNRAVVHLANDQPVVVELVADPQPGDLSLICKNVRTLDGKRPVFIDSSDSTFVFPFAFIRFIEIPVGDGGGRREVEVAEPEDLEIDEDFLRRVREA
jgi:hypothetical protein